MHVAIRPDLDQGNGEAARLKKHRHVYRVVLGSGPTMDEQNIRMAIDRHWAASAAGDQIAEHEIYHDDTVCEYPQSGEVIHGRSNLQALRSHHPGRPSGFAVRRIVGKGNLWVTEYVITYEGKRAYTVSIMEFRDGRVAHEIQYFADPFDAPAWRAQWVERGA
jgi:SnoaL-like domain